MHDTETRFPTTTTWLWSFHVTEPHVPGVRNALVRTRWVDCVRQTWPLDVDIFAVQSTLRALSSYARAHSYFFVSSLSSCPSSSSSSTSSQLDVSGSRRTWECLVRGLKTNHRSFCWVICCCCWFTLLLLSFAWTVSSELLGFIFSYFFVSVRCVRLSWPSRQFLKRTSIYRIVSYLISTSSLRASTSLTEIIPTLARNS